jgi:hypothetical protein
VQVEVKASAKQVDRIVKQLDAARELVALPASVVKEIEYVLDLAPGHLWFVGPGSVDPAAYVYAVEVDGLNAAFTPVTDVPRCQS